MITLRGVTKSFGGQTLYEGADFQINTGDRFALVGPNGSGKSTLFRMILGEQEPDSGEIALRSGVRMGYLAQETAALHGGSVIEETLREATGDSRVEARAKKILMGLGFRTEDFDRPVTALSGGWQMRVMIARLLLDEPDLLMLDEPTNHLDLESLLWFQNYLQRFRGAILLISHDRAFIDAVAQRIVEVRDGRLHLYNTPFQAFLDQKKAEHEALVSAYKRQQKEIEDLELFISRFRAKASLAASVQSKIKYLERMERIELPPEANTVSFSFPQPARSGVNALTLVDVKQSYDGKRLIYDGLNLTLERGQRVALVGPNGAGKSTLLKLLAGQIAFEAGERKLGHQVEVGYFSQHRAAMFTSGRTVFEEACDTRRAHSETTIRSVLGSFLFSGDSVFKRVDVLSGGEKSRLGLARLLLDPPNVLLMDEPTTHLDIASVDMLVQALERFDGTIGFISHDVYFIRKIANNVLHVKDGNVTWYPGDYDYFLHKKELEEGDEAELFRDEAALEAAVEKASAKPAAAAADAAASERRGPKTKEQKRREAEERNARYREERERKDRGESEAQLATEEEALLAELSDPATHAKPGRAVEVSRRLAEIQQRRRAPGA